MINKTINDFNHIFFIGVAGTGMSAIAQYLAGIGKNISGSDRYFLPGIFNETKEKLEAENIQCFIQNGEGITEQTDLVVVSRQRLQACPAGAGMNRRNTPASPTAARVPRRRGDEPGNACTFVVQA